VYAFITLVLNLEEIILFTRETVRLDRTISEEEKQIDKVFVRFPRIAGPLQKIFLPIPLVLFTSDLKTPHIFDLLSFHASQSYQNKFSPESYIAVFKKPFSFHSNFFLK